MLTALLFAVSFSAAQPAAPANPDWSHLKAGMSEAETVQRVGAPLMRNAGHGLELWVYDAGANIIFLHQRVDSWTPPAAPALLVVAVPPPHEEKPVVLLPSPVGQLAAR
ncbi:MAG: hypothetical protein ACHQ5A_12710 [Opitutales bacterium]